MIKDLINANANVQVVLSLADLKEAFIEWANEKNEQTDDEQLSANEVASILNVSKPTLWRWEKMGYLIPHRVGRKPYYSKSQLNLLMREG